MNLKTQIVIVFVYLFAALRVYKAKEVLTNISIIKKEDIGYQTLLNNIRIVTALITAIVFMVYAQIVEIPIYYVGLLYLTLIGEYVYGFRLDNKLQKRKEINKTE